MKTAIKPNTSIKTELHSNSKAKKKKIIELNLLNTLKKRVYFHFRTTFGCLAAIHCN